MGIPNREDFVKKKPTLLNSALHPTVTICNIPCCTVWCKYLSIYNSKISEINIAVISGSDTILARIPTIKIGQALSAIIVN